MKQLKVYAENIIESSENARLIRDAVSSSHLRVRELRYDDAWQKYTLTTNTMYGNLLPATILGGLIEKLARSLDTKEIVFDFRETQKNGGYPCLQILCAK